MTPNTKPDMNSDMLSTTLAAQPTQVGYQSSSVAGLYDSAQDIYGTARSGWSPVTDDEQLWSSLAHWGGVAMGVLGAMGVLMTKGDVSSFVRGHAEEAVNFQLLLVAAWIASLMATFILIGWLMLPMVLATSIYYARQGAKAARAGESYKYPYTIRLIK